VKLGAYLIWAAFAVASGVIVLLGYFVRLEPFISLRLMLMRWAVLLAAAALVIGLINLLSVHLTKVSEQEPGWPYSAVLILLFSLTLALGLFFGPDNRVVLFLFNNLQLPVESSLMALLAITLTIAGFRLVARRRDVISLTFAITALLVIIGTSPWPLASDSQVHVGMTYLRTWIAQVWAAGGARGILLGVALGAITTGLRVLMAADRPYGE
jgi:hypothetical protein